MATTVPLCLEEWPCAITQPTRLRSLGPHDIDLWCIEIDEIVEGSPLWTQGLNLLDTEERVRLERSRFAKDRASFLVTRVLVRTALSRYAASEPGHWVFGFNPFGRPMIVAPNVEPRLHFSLSHTAGLAICAISLFPDIGVDVECLLRRPIGPEMAKKFLSRVEFDHLQSVPPEERPLMLLRYWTLKEAYVKARGMGLSLPLSAVMFQLDGAARPIYAEFAEQIQDAPADWMFRQFSITEKHVCGIAFRQKPTHLGQICIIASANSNVNLRPLM